MNVGVNAVPDFVPRSFFVDRSGESREEKSFHATWTSSDITTKDREYRNGLWEGKLVRRKHTESPHSLFIASTGFDCNREFVSERNTDSNHQVR
jgi:hypothetical protein